MISLSVVVTFLTVYSSFAPLGDLLGQQEVTPFFFFHETRDGSSVDFVNYSNMSGEAKMR